jgi:hypothetical protein
MENAFAAFHFARDSLRWPLDSIKVFGRSIGTGPAMALASLFKFAGVILVTPFLSVQDLFRDRIGPLAQLVQECFWNAQAAPKISSPTMIIHGQRDELIACKHGESIYELITTRKIFVSPPDMEHNTNLLTNLQYFVLPMFHFFALPDYVFQDIEVPTWAYTAKKTLEETSATENRPYKPWRSGRTCQEEKQLAPGPPPRQPVHPPSPSSPQASPRLPPQSEEALQRMSAQWVEKGAPPTEIMEAMHRLEEFEGKLRELGVSSSQRTYDDESDLDLDNLADASKKAAIPVAATAPRPTSSPRISGPGLRSGCPKPEILPGGQANCSDEVEFSYDQDWRPMAARGDADVAPCGSGVSNGWRQKVCRPGIPPMHPFLSACCRALPLEGPGSAEDPQLTRSYGALRPAPMEEELVMQVGDRVCVRPHKPLGLSI